jgi:hypothetical protein
MSVERSRSASVLARSGFTNLGNPITPSVILPPRTGLFISARELTSQAIASELTISAINILRNKNFSTGLNFEAMSSIRLRRRGDIRLLKAFWRGRNITILEYI